jgi:hypothetical protein
MFPEAVCVVSMADHLLHNAKVIAIKGPFRNKYYNSIQRLLR